MKILFPIIALGVVTFVTTYLFLRGWQSLSKIPWLRLTFATLYLLSFSAFMLKMFVGDNMDPVVGLWLSRIGFTWLVAVIYLALLALSLDIIRVVNHFTGFYPAFIRENYQIVKLTLALGGALIVSGLLIYGNWKFNHPEVRELTVTIDKPLPEGGIDIVLASDIHLSNYINREKFKKYVELINSQNPDLVMLAGDISDRNVKPLVDGNIAELFREIRSEYGIYAVTGNHEFYGGDRESIYSYYRSAGLNLLIDSVARVSTPAGDIMIIGRDDRTNNRREALSDLVVEVDKKLPLILMDHQPINLGEAESAGIDLQLSGHTHQGQFWPGNFIVKRMYELSHGYKQRGNTHYVVSSGLGLWGPEFRIGTVSELVLIHLCSSSSQTTESVPEQ
ncbi:MAG: metallophosphoesterase [Bacteroidales bacterium]|nr:metallophosphoesterase [Bacteroidales bacterium]